tara:strand:- start:176 stop:574 length:399 start_codon:yes stop_codon:yes gene_type:complete
MAPKRGKTYRTANGQKIDFGALLLANEKSPALGNMNVNARGDEIDATGNIVKSREDVMREYNELNTMIPQDGDIPTGGLEADDWQDWEPPVKEQPAAVKNIDVPAETKTETSSAKKSTGGLAAAVAAAKEKE